MAYLRKRGDARFRLKTRGIAVNTPAERARAYRLHAEEARTAAESMRHPESRATLMRIARDYDVMADHLEARNPELPRKTP